MALEQIQDPVITDSTGQSILSTLNGIKNVITPLNVYLDIAVTLTSGNWSNSSPYTYTWTSDKVVEDCGIEVHFASGAENTSTPYIEYEKGGGSVIFTAPSKPDADIPVVVRIINAEASSVTSLDAESVSTDGIPGASNVQDALESVNSSLGTINEQIANMMLLYDKTNQTVDCDNLTSTGFYRLAGTISNSPNGASRLVLLVLESATNFFTQIAFVNLQNDWGTYVRRKLSGSSWTSWQIFSQT